jgi:cytoskeletal protein CcmA (bactofilin family)
MDVFTGKLEGPIDVRGPWNLQGMVAGNLTAHSGADLIVDGMVTGDLIVNQGARVLLNGMVNGVTIVRGGSIQVFGHTSRVQIEDDTADVFIDPKALIGE